MRLRTIAILRGEQPERAVELAERCWTAGIDVVEVPVQGAAGWAAFEAVAAVAQGRVFGAGTVLAADDARRAIELGAALIISPGIDEDVVRAASAAGVASLPGVLSPTEVSLAVRLGVPTCKFFPADVLGGNWLAAMRGPFPGVRFVAVGGVNPYNAKDFLAAGARGVAFGSSVADVLALPDPAAFVAELHARAD